MEALPRERWRPAEMKADEAHGRPGGGGGGGGGSAAEAASSGMISSITCGGAKQVNVISIANNHPTITDQRGYGYEDGVQP